MRAICRKQRANGSLARLHLHSNRNLPKPLDRFSIAALQNKTRTPSNRTSAPLLYSQNGVENNEPAIEPTPPPPALSPKHVHSRPCNMPRLQTHQTHSLLIIGVRSTTSTIGGDGSSSGRGQKWKKVSKRIRSMKTQQPETTRCVNRTITPLSRNLQQHSSTITWQLALTPK